MTHFDEEKSLPAIKIPVLIIAGEYDRVTKRIASERMHELIPHSKLAIFPGGHQQLLEYRELVMPEIANFAATLDLDGGIPKYPHGNLSGKPAGALH